MNYNVSKKKNSMVKQKKTDIHKKNTQITIETGTKKDLAEGIGEVFCDQCEYEICDSDEELMYCDNDEWHPTIYKVCEKCYYET